jgi:threonine dehydrogenase-like Zn-dependent dehydrogenase
VRCKASSGTDLKEASLVHIALISITALRASHAELGDYAAVVGQGLVGNFAAQLLLRQGARVIAIDRLAGRLETAKQCGVEMVVDASQTDPVQAVKDLTGGAGAEVVVEATGSAAGALTAMDLAARNGEVILLGTPRGSYEADVIPLLRAVHRASPNVTMKGAHGYSIPQTPDPYVKHSLSRNATILMDMFGRKELVMQPLVSRVVKPEEAPDAYRQLREQPEKLMGVIFDWTG